MIGDGRILKAERSPRIIINSKRHSRLKARNVFTFSTLIELFSLLTIRNSLHTFASSRQLDGDGEWQRIGSFDTFEQSR